MIEHGKFRLRLIVRQIVRLRLVHKAKTNDGSTPRLLGTRNPFVP